LDLAVRKTQYVPWFSDVTRLETAVILILAISRVTFELGVDTVFDFLDTPVYRLLQQARGVHTAPQPTPNLQGSSGRAASRARSKRACVTKTSIWCVMDLVICLRTF